MFNTFVINLLLLSLIIFISLCILSIILDNRLTSYFTESNPLSIFLAFMITIAAIAFIAIAFITAILFIITIIRDIIYIKAGSLIKYNSFSASKTMLITVDIIDMISSIVLGIIILGINNDILNVVGILITFVMLIISIISMTITIGTNTKVDNFID